MNDRTPFKPDSEPEGIEQLPVEPTPQAKEVNYMDDIEYHRVADSLDISYDERRLPKVAQELSFLYDWAKEVTKSEDRVERIIAIRELQRNLGIQQRGLETIKKLYQYARLDQDKRRIEREMSLIGNLPEKTGGV